MSLLKSQNKKSLKIWKINKFWNVIGKFSLIYSPLVSEDKMGCYIDNEIINVITTWLFCMSEFG